MEYTMYMRTPVLIAALALTAVGHTQAVKVQSTLRTKLAFAANVPVTGVGAHQLASSSFAVVTNGFVNQKFLPCITIVNRNGVATANYFWDRPESFQALISSVSSDGKTVYVAGRYRDANVADRGWIWVFNTDTQLGFTMPLALPNASFWADTPTHIAETATDIYVAGFRGETSANALTNGRPFVSKVDKLGIMSSYAFQTGIGFDAVRVTGFSVGGGRALVIGNKFGSNASTYFVTENATMSIFDSGTLDSVKAGGASYDPAANVHLMGYVGSQGTIFGLFNNVGIGFSSYHAGSAYENAKMGTDGATIFVNNGLRVSKYRYYDQVNWTYNPTAIIFAQPPIGISINSLSEIITGNYGKSDQVYLTKLSSTGVRRWEIFHGPANMTYRPNGFDVHEKSGDILVLGTSRTANLDLAQLTVLRQAPTAINDSFYTGKNKQFYKSLVQNDRAALGSTATIVQGPTNGTASISTIGNLTYNPNPNFTGVDTIKYQLSKPGLNSSIATCTLRVNP